MQFAAYYFPNFHPDPRHTDVHGPGWTEWELLKQATPRFPGHRQPRTPMWGYENEADPTVMQKKIRCAWEHGLDAFIFDWYFYQDGLFLQQALERGFMPAADGTTLRFALMWANHNWNDIHPWAAGTPFRTLYPGRLDDDSFDRMCDCLIERYFPHPAYWRLHGKLYFSVYNLPFLGDLKRLNRLRERAAAAGFPLHLNLIIPGNPILPDELGMPTFADVLKEGYADTRLSTSGIRMCEWTLSRSSLMTAPALESLRSTAPSPIPCLSPFSPMSPQVGTARRVPAKTPLTSIMATPTAQ